MAKGPGRHHSQTTLGAKLRWNAAKQSTVVETRIVPPIVFGRDWRDSVAQIIQKFHSRSWIGSRVSNDIGNNDAYLANFLDAAISAAAPAEDADACIWVSKRYHYNYINGMIDT